MITLQKIINAAGLLVGEYYVVPGTQIAAVRPDRLQAVRDALVGQPQYLRWLEADYGLMATHLDWPARFKQHRIAKIIRPESGVPYIEGAGRALDFVKTEYVAAAGNGSPHAPLVSEGVGLFAVAMSIPVGVTPPEYNGGGVYGSTQLGCPLDAMFDVLWGARVGALRRITAVMAAAAGAPPGQPFLNFTGALTGTASDAVVISEPPPLLDHTAGPWPLIVGPAVLTRIEYTLLDDVLRLAFIAVNHSDVADYLERVLPSVADPNERSAFERRLARLRATPQDTLAMVRPCGANPYTFVRDFESSAGELIARTGVEDGVDLTAGNARLSSQEVFVGASPGASDLSALTPLPAGLPTTVQIYIQVDGRFAWSGQEGLFDSDELIALVTQLLSTGREIDLSFVGGASPHTIPPSAAINVSRAQDRIEGTAQGAAAIAGVTPSYAGDCLGYVMIGAAMAPPPSSQLSVMNAILTPGFMDLVP